MPGGGGIGVVGHGAGWALALVPLVLVPVLSTGSASLPSGAAAAAEPGLATVHVHIALSDVWVEPPPVDIPGPGPEATKDWIIDARINATDDARSGPCRAQARSMHSRFIVPLGLDFFLRFDPAEADCLGATYRAVLFGYGHTSLKPIDFDGEADTRAAILSFQLTAPPARGRVNGTGDGRPLDIDGAFAYEVRVMASSLPLPPEAEVVPRTRWLVKVMLDQFEVLNPATRMGNDWFLDAEVRAVDPAQSACHAQLRSMHARFFPPRTIDLILLDPGPCAGSPMQLRLVPWLHLDDGLLDIDGDAPENVCPGIPWPSGAAAGACDAVLNFPLQHGFSATLVADGFADHVPLELEYDARLAYRVLVEREPAEAGLHLRVDHELSGLNPLWLHALLDDWNLDVQAVGVGDCVAQRRSSHSFYAPFQRVDLVFVGGDAAACLRHPVRLDFAAYWLFDNLFDIDPRSLAEGGTPCPTTVPMYELVHVPPLHDPLDEALAEGCVASATWDPGAGRVAGTLDGALDGFPDLLDAELTWQVEPV